MNSMKTYTELNNQITDTLRTQGDLAPLKTEWLLTLRKISAFIDMFLKRFGHLVMDNRNASPEWALYSKKTDQFHAYSRAIRNVEYFIAKGKLTNA